MSNVSIANRIEINMYHKVLLQLWYEQRKRLDPLKCDYVWHKTRIKVRDQIDDSALVCLTQLRKELS